MAYRNTNDVTSTETILNYENRDQLSDWSVVWSTGHVPGMDMATGGGVRRRAVGRRRLRYGALALGSLLTMHMRLTSAAITGGYFVYVMLLIPAVAFLANPMRHFEVYLGQWSISGPGRAFRIIPMFDGIGLAIAIGSLIRAILNCVIAGLAAIYLLHAVSDEALPSTVCRDFDLNTYKPELTEEPNVTRFRVPRAINIPNIEVHTPYRAVNISNMILTPYQAVNISNIEVLTPYLQLKPDPYLPINSSYALWNPMDSELDFRTVENMRLLPNESHMLQVCKDPYAGKSYPPNCKTAAYNFYYVEVAQYRSNAMFKGFNVDLAIMIVINWAIIWGCMVIERISHGRLIWNNLPPWFMWVPVAWIVAVIACAAQGFISKYKDLLKPKFKMHSGSMVQVLSDALETALYIHASSAGSEIVHGKGLNHYASGHIDADLNGENVWHSSILTVLSALSSGVGAVCAINDFSQTRDILNNTGGCTTWILPMYSRCATFGTHTHLKSVVIYSGLIFSYVTVSYVLVKTALHTIFEYRVKLVFVEQYLVGALVLACTGLSMVFTTQGGLPLLESIDTIMVGFAMPFICGLEMLGLIYIYNGHDFVSDMNLSMEENACSSRMEIQWQLLPAIILIMLVLRISTVFHFVMPAEYVWLGMVPLVAVVIAVPIRACHNAYVFLRPSPRHGI